MATSNITEKYEFLTQIHTSYDGSEQRAALRQSPRQYLSFNYSAMKPWEAQWLKGLTHLKQTDLIYIPMWHRAASIRDNVYKGSTTIELEYGKMFGFRDSGALTFFSEDKINESADTYKIDFFTTTNNIAVKPGARSYKDKAIENIIPMLQCIVQPADDVKFDFSSAWRGTLNYEVMPMQQAPKLPFVYGYDNDEFMLLESLYGMPKTYNNYEVFRLEPAWVSDIGTKVEKNVEKLDNESGVVLYDLKSSMTSDVYSIDFNFLDIPTINNMIRFFYRQKGKLKPFYMPTWLNDMTFVRPMKKGDTTVYVALSDLFRYYMGNNRRMKLIVFLKDFTSVVLDIGLYDYLTYPDVVEPIGKLLLKTPLPRDIDLNDIAMSSYFIMCRFDDDSLTLNYETVQVATTTLSFKEVDA